MTKRDRGWLPQITFSEASLNYYLETSDAISLNIVSELEYLISNSQRIEQIEAANLVFAKVADTTLGEEGFTLALVNNQYVISGTTSRAWLYGLYEFHRKLSRGSNFASPLISIPDQAFRMINQWDNVDGSVERGYAGESIFYVNNDFRRDYELVTQYARLLSSVGINNISINNVNVHDIETSFIVEPHLTDVKKTADIFAKFGIKTFLSINFAAPVQIGQLDTADPLDKGVIAWWEKVVKGIYQAIPEFGGFLVKADSEHRPGPFSYGRNHDEGANLLGRALKPFGGKVIWRCFVYNCVQDWRDRSTDRARAAYDHFLPLDGNFEDNVILQIKNGPIDFQVREPISPLFGSLKKTNQILELQIAQEYTGQQLHICYLLPMWKEILDFDTKTKQGSSFVKDVVKENSPQIFNSGIAAVSNIGFDYNWTGHKLSQANLYGYGRLIWDNSLSAATIATEWVDLTYPETKNKAAITEILLSSRETYENYTAPLGIGFMVRPNHHYGPDVDGYEYDRWGTYHFADRDGIGVNRSLANGTGYARQYADDVFEIYENLETCPDNLLLFFHHVNYNHKLQSGKTVIQHIYDTHFAGVEQVEDYLQVWESLADDISDHIGYENVSARLAEQHRCAKEWRDQINTYFYRKSGISDLHNRKIY